MAQSLKIRLDREGDFLEVRFSDAPGYLRETDHDAVMERVAAAGHVLGFTGMAVSKLDKDHPPVAQLAAASWLRPSTLTVPYGRTVIFLITTGLTGWLMPPSMPIVVGVFAIASTTSRPLVTRAKIT